MANYHTLCSVHCIDADGDPGILPLFDYVADSVTLAGQVTKVAAVAGNFEMVTGAQILKGSITIEFPLTAGKSSPVTACDVQKGALFTLNAAGTTYKQGIFVPAFTPAMMIGNEIDLENQYVAALLTNLLANWCDKYDNDLTSLSRARKRFRK